jgi:hypothetical protein
LLKRRVQLVQVLLLPKLVSRNLLPLRLESISGCPQTMSAAAHAVGRRARYRTPASYRWAETRKKSLATVSTDVTLMVTARLGFNRTLISGYQLVDEVT